MDWPQAPPSIVFGPCPNYELQDSSFAACNSLRIRAHQERTIEGEFHVLARAIHRVKVDALSSAVVKQIKLCGS
jgi:hypothetical protein